MASAESSRQELVAEADVDDGGGSGRSVAIGIGVGVGFVALAAAVAVKVKARGNSNAPVTISDATAPAGAPTLVSDSLTVGVQQLQQLCSVRSSVPGVQAGTRGAKEGELGPRLA